MILYKSSERGQICEKGKTNCSSWFLGGTKGLHASGSKL